MGYLLHATADRSAAVDVRSTPPVILSFDIEEHDRIEAASRLAIPTESRQVYRDRMVRSTEWILDELAARGIRATFFVVGQIAEHHPELVREIAQAGHEVASHSWLHRRIHTLTPGSFREDLLRSRDALEAASGQRVVGFRAPTFSLVRSTAWALDVLSDLGFLYDSSIYPVRHDRYGVAHAPRVPFLASHGSGQILEIPPATLRVGRMNLPIGGGGYFRLLPLRMMIRAIEHSRRGPAPGPTMLYFHPWEFDPGQPRLPLRPASRFRTYVGLGESRRKLRRLLDRYRFERAIDMAHTLLASSPDLPHFRLD